MMVRCAVLLALLPAALTSPVQPREAADCDDVHIFLARGTGEDYPGRQISIVYAVCSRSLRPPP